MQFCTAIVNPRFRQICFNQKYVLRYLCQTVKKCASKNASQHACRFDVVESVICSFIPTFIVPDTKAIRVLSLEAC